MPPPRPRLSISSDVNISGPAAQIIMSFHPQTPQSPSQYSPSIDPTTIMTTSITTVTTALPTPAHSVSGTSIPSESHDANMSEDPLSPLKRKRGSEDVGDRAQKKVQFEDRRLDIGNLHQDVGEIHLLCRTPHLNSSVTPFEDLFKRCGLTSFAAEYARVLPNGEKNALRKTYKGHIKRLGVNGHFDSVNEEWNRPDGFLALCSYPPEEWQIQQVRGKEVGKGFSRETLGKLERALTMGKGVVPKSVWDTSVLGDLAPGKADKQASARPTAPSTPAAVATSTSRPKQSSLVQEATRPKRAGKKRAYGDSSFEGYGEGFPDDQVQGSAYSVTEGDVGAPGQKRRKKTATPAQQYQQVRQSSYGPGMVGA